MIPPSQTLDFIPERVQQSRTDGGQSVLLAKIFGGRSLEGRSISDLRDMVRERAQECFKPREEGKDWRPEESYLDEILKKSTKIGHAFELLLSSAFTYYPSSNPELEQETYLAPSEYDEDSKIDFLTEGKFTNINQTGINQKYHLGMQFTTSNTGDTIEDKKKKLVITYYKHHQPQLYPRKPGEKIFFPRNLCLFSMTHPSISNANNAERVADTGTDFFSRSFDTASQTGKHPLDCFDTPMTKSSFLMASFFYNHVVQHYMDNMSLTSSKPSIAQINGKNIIISTETDKDGISWKHYTFFWHGFCYKCSFLVTNQMPLYEKKPEYVSKFFEEKFGRIIGRKN